MKHTEGEIMNALAYNGEELLSLAREAAECKLLLSNRRFNRKKMEYEILLKYSCEEDPLCTGPEYREVLNRERVAASELNQVMQTARSCIRHPRSKQRT